MLASAVSTHVRHKTVRWLYRSVACPGSALRVKIEGHGLALLRWPRLEYQTTSFYIKTASWRFWRLACGFASTRHRWGWRTGNAGSSLVARA